MSTNLFRNVLLGLAIAALGLMTVVAYGRFRTVGKEGADSCLRMEAGHNTELPWEALATQWFRAVSL